MLGWQRLPAEVSCVEMVVTPSGAIMAVGRQMARDACLGTLWLGERPVLEGRPTLIYLGLLLRTRTFKPERYPTPINPIIVVIVIESQRHR